MRQTTRTAPYFPFNLQIAGATWRRLDLDEAAAGLPETARGARVMFFRKVADRLNSLPEQDGSPVKGGTLNLYDQMLKAYRHVIDHYTWTQGPDMIQRAMAATGHAYDRGDMKMVMEGFTRFFPPKTVRDDRESAAASISGDRPDHYRKEEIVKELLLLRVAAENRALDPFRILFDDTDLAEATPYRRVMADIERELRMLSHRIQFDGTDLVVASPYRRVMADIKQELRTTSHSASFCISLPDLLRAPLKAAPDSLAKQMEYISENWEEILPVDVLEELPTTFGIVKEESREWGGEADGTPAEPQHVLEFGYRGEYPDTDDHYPEPERFSPDVDWMPNVVLMAKMVYVWLGQLSKKYGREITRLDQIPDEELDLLARWGFTGLWLIGIWERSPASQKIKRLCGNQEAISSAYSLFDYQIASDLGGWEALGNFRERALAHGIRLASDMVPNHTGIYSKCIVDHPDWFVQLDYSPYPSYTFDGPDLSFSPEISLQIEDGYWDKRDAAVVFKHFDHRDGRSRYIYHGNDGTSTPWNDTAQLNYLNPEVREEVIRTILHVAHNFPIIRFDAAMTLAKKHYQRLWYPQPGHGSGVPSRAEHGMTRDAFDDAMPEEFWRQVVDRVAAEAPDTLLLAEAFWLMEGYFVRTLGMHRVYNSAFMNILKMEENAKYRQTIKNVLEFDHEVLKRFVNFMNNPDERTAIEQFGKEKKYLGATVMLVTMPGLPMFGHGQIEGFHEKYGMEYKRAVWDEPVDEYLVAEHEAQIFPLMRRRRIFSGSENFVLYDFFFGDAVDENVFAYSNRTGSERGLILYNNQFGRTTGWIRTSTSRAETTESGETRQTQTILGEALSFNPDELYFYVFRDLASGLEYIRHGRDLCEKGLYVELEGYEYHAFLDFREIRDDDKGAWGKLCSSLHGRPVTNIDEEVKLIRFERLIDSFRDIYTGIDDTLEAVFGGKGPVVARNNVLRGLRKRLTTFFMALGETAGSDVDASEAAAAVVEELALIGSDGRETHVPSLPWMKRGKDPYDQLFLFALVVLRGIGIPCGMEERAECAATRFAQFGFRRALEEIFTEASGDAGITSVLLISILLDYKSFFQSLEVETCPVAMLRLFNDRKVRQFLRVHKSDGVEWFVKERFEMFLEGLAITGHIERMTGPAASMPVAREQGTFFIDVARLNSVAGRAGYRVDRFLDLIAENADHAGENEVGYECHTELG